jgi:hypothetical protein
LGNYINPTDITSWPSGTADADKIKAIALAEQLLEKILGRVFYAQPFVLELNGNGKNRLMLPTYEDILTVASVFIDGIELDPSWWTYDANSIYLDLTASGTYTSGYPWAEYYYRLSEADERGIFPRGYNNIRVTGTKGEATIPQPIIEALIKMVDKMNEGIFWTGGLFKSESIGDYSYDLGLADYVKEGILTGFPEIDRILRHYMRQKKAIFLAP